MTPGFLPLRHELIVDNFAGGGGASTGIEAAFGRSVDLAVNHDGAALAMHEANHPGTRHLCGDVFDVDPLEVTKGQPVGLAWFSPDCTHFSKAKGGQPRKKEIRGLAWVVVRWAQQVKPRVIMLENVEEFQDWGPLTEDGRPCPERKGMTFRRWKKQLENAGYAVDMRELRACDYGAPTIRKRLFVIARCDGRPIVWPKPTHGPRRKPYRTAASCIDWSIPCPSIFERKRPLAEATMRRIARGIRKYVIEAERPFIVGVGGRMGQSPERGTDSPFQTVTTKADSALVVPTLIQTGYGERPGQDPRVPGLEKPLGTCVAGGCKHALVAAFLAKHYGGNETPGTSLDGPMSTVTSKDHHALVTSRLVEVKGTCQHEQGTDRPVGAQAGCHLTEVKAFLLKYYGTDQDPRLEEPLHTITTKDRFGLVMIGGDEYRICDIGMRMLSPRELFNAQGFPAEYIIDPVFRGKALNKTQQVRLCGNSVCPQLSQALVEANFAHESAYEATA